MIFANVKECSRVVFVDVTNDFISHPLPNNRVVMSMRNCSQSSRTSASMDSIVRPEWCAWGRSSSLQQSSVLTRVMHGVCSPRVSSRNSNGPEEKKKRISHDAEPRK